MKTVTLEQTPTSFFLPAADVLAVFHAVSKEETRYYLNGVFVEAMAHADSLEIESLRLVATDGHVLLHLDLTETGAFMGAAVSTQAADSARTRGFILSMDVTEKALKAKLPPSADLWLYGDTETGVIQAVAKYPNDMRGDEVARYGVLEFSQIDGTFPDYTRVLPPPGADGVPSCIFDPALLVRLTKGAAMISDHRQPRVMLTQHTTGDPMTVKFSGAPRLTGVMMPCRFLDG